MRSDSSMLDYFIPVAINGNHASVEIDATPAGVWTALNELRLRECRLTGALLAVRALPAAATRRGALRRRTRKESFSDARVIDAMTSNRLLLLHREEPDSIVLGVIGQFWKPAGGTDVEVADVDAFIGFDEPGYVKSAVDFVIESTPRGTRLSTTTRNQVTDDIAARKFSRYWALVGWGSRLTRLDILRAVRRRAEH